MRGEEGRAGTGYAHRGADGLDIGPTSMGDLCMRRTGCGLNPMRPICDLWAGTAMKRAFAHALLTAVSTQPTHAVRNERHRGAHHSKESRPRWHVVNVLAGGSIVACSISAVADVADNVIRSTERREPGRSGKAWGWAPPFVRGALGRALVSGWLSDKNK